MSPTCHIKSYPRFFPWGGRWATVPPHFGAGGAAGRVLFGGWVCPFSLPHPPDGGLEILQPNLRWEGAWPLEWRGLGFDEGVEILNQLRTGGEVMGTRGVEARGGGGWGEGHYIIGCIARQGIKQNRSSPPSPAPLCERINVGMNVTQALWVCFG
jgi:hypothetical protein